jgi:hypothetical protein
MKLLADEQAKEPPPKMEISSRAHLHRATTAKD